MGEYFKLRMSKITATLFIPNQSPGYLPCSSPSYTTFWIEKAEKD